MPVECGGAAGNAPAVFAHQARGAPIFHPDHIQPRVAPKATPHDLVAHEEVAIWKAFPVAAQPLLQRECVIACASCRLTAQCAISVPWR